MARSTIERVAAKIAEINKRQTPVRKKIKEVVTTPKVEAKAQEDKVMLQSILDNKKMKATKKLEMVLKYLKK